MTVQTRVIFILGLLCLASCTAPASVQRAPGDAKPLIGRFDARVWRSPAGTELTYRLLKPENYDATRKYPLLIYLHGSGEKGNNNVSQMKPEVVTFLLSPQMREKYPCFAMVPQCPRDDSWPKIGYPESGVSNAGKMVLEVIEELEKEFSIDPQRLYIGGHSMGAYGTWDLIGRYPDLFAAGFSISGAYLPARAALVKDVPLWAFQGDKDGNVSVKTVREMIAAVEKAGGKPKYTEYPGAGHGIASTVLQDPTLPEWLFAQKRAAPGSMRQAVVPPIEPPAGYPATLPLKGTWTGTLGRTAHKVPRLRVQETPFRLKPSDAAGAEVQATLDRVAGGQLTGECEISGTALIIDNMLWILVDGMKPKGE
jgi:predicted peptidase